MPEPPKCAVGSSSILQNTGGFCRSKRHPRSRFCGRLASVNSDRAALGHIDRRVSDLRRAS
jgi:hypothetical protein